ncbi:DUF488 family protein [Geobacter sp. SVR]|uniref:DUF488 domain-containing protein n=1 Tax=Geobacter sp. SVR TaxID=2495594 RepID=UPI00143F01AF|nr:DUF488 domain-containing protein [Geobacter sp. SVR]BCS52171.1 hypothetical protein GSVR_04790 [Geobacter sp. SVR]GCF86626.1 hypothetical protein GSbR_32260 [Geobacter sp. SVR]
MTVRERKEEIAADKLVIYTIGHSTRSLDDFLELLRHHGVARLVDVRTIPRSRHNPQFNGETLAAFLRHHRIGYRHMKELGGLRHARADSVNTGWHNLSFRGFADYMQTAEFAAALAELLELAHERPTAIMCAEAVPWRCHRSLIADSLTVRGVEVRDILSITGIKPHQVTRMAQVDGIHVTYPAGPDGEG